MRIVKPLAVLLASTLLMSGCLMWHSKSNVRLTKPPAPNAEARKRIPLRVVLNCPRTSRNLKFRDSVMERLKRSCASSPAVNCVGGGNYRLTVSTFAKHQVNALTIVASVVTLFAVAPIMGTDTFTARAVLKDHRGRVYAVRNLKHTVRWAVNFPVMILGLPLTLIPGSKAFAAVDASHRLGARFSKDLLMWMERQVQAMDAHLKGPKDVVQKAQRCTHRG